MSIKLIDFDVAYREAGHLIKNIILGNGFNKALKPDIFSYDDIKEVIVSKSDRLGRLYDLLQQNSPEFLQGILERSNEIVLLYGGDENISRRFKEDIKEIQETFVSVISEKHPETINDISDCSIGSARSTDSTQKIFTCSNFLTKFNNIFTINYDLLAYWSIMKSNTTKHLPFIDGFGKSDDDKYFDERLIWPSNNSNEKQNVFYLHGGLHLYAFFDKIEKIAKDDSNTIIRLIRGQIVNGHYPLCITGGTSDKKKMMIDSHSYFRHCLASLNKMNGTLFDFGFNYSDIDDHIFSAIKDSNVEKVFVSVYGDPEVEDNNKKIQKCKGLHGFRGKEVYFYNAETANVWG